jgi:hypothetical protein
MLIHPRYNTLHKTDKTFNPKTYIAASQISFLLGYFGTAQERADFWSSGGTKKRPYVHNSNMNWGLKNEHKSIESVLDVFKDITIEIPDYKFVTTGHFAGKIGAKPDGLIYMNGNLTGTLECKCKSPYTKGDINMTIEPHKSIPGYYLPQIQIEMLTNGVERSIFTSWTLINGSTFFEVEIDNNYIEELFGLFYDMEYHFTKERHIENIEAMLAKFRIKTDMLAKRILAISQ